MEKTISYINIMPDTQAGINLFVDKVLSEVEIREALPLLAKLTAMEKICELIRDGLKDQILEEASLTGEKSFTIGKVRYEKRTRTGYVYTHCPLHGELKARIKKLEDVMKVIEAPIADTETGEIIEPAHKSYTDYIAVTLPKE